MKNNKKYLIYLIGLLVLSFNVFATEESNSLNNRSRFSFGDYLDNVFASEDFDPYHNMQAQVRLSSDLCQQEEEFLENRKFITKKSIEKIVGFEINENEVPKIAFCFSGGGYRSMVYTLGSFISADQEGILDATTYISTLSGSTWAVASWIAHKMDLNDLKELMKSQISKPIHSGIDVDNMLENAFWKIIYGQRLTFVGIWGSFLGNMLFSDFEDRVQYFDNLRVKLTKKQMPRLSQSAKIISMGRFPLPIYTAVNVIEGYDWFEFTPFEIGSFESKMFVPSWSFGRKFKNGKSANYSPEHGLDYLMGIWGSAFTASTKEILENYQSSIPSILFEPLDMITGNPECGLGRLRISPARVRNFVYGVYNHLFKDRKNLILVDAGLDFNLPLPPLLRKERKADIVIVCDASSVVDGAPELFAAKEWAKENGIKFPEIETEKINNQLISVFKDQNDLDVPVIIYMPRIKNEEYSKIFDPTESIKNYEYCHTFNLQYEPGEFEELCGLAQYNFLQSSEVIKEVIRDFILQRRSLN